MAIMVPPFVMVSGTPTVANFNTWATDILFMMAPEVVLATGSTTPAASTWTQATLTGGPDAAAGDGVSGAITANAFVASEGGLYVVYYQVEFASSLVGRREV